MEKWDWWKESKEKIVRKALRVFLCSNEALNKHTTLLSLSSSSIIHHPSLPPALHPPSSVINSNSPILLTYHQVLYKIYLVICLWLLLQCTVEQSTSKRHVWKLWFIVSIFCKCYCASSYKKNLTLNSVLFLYHFDTVYLVSHLKLGEIRCKLSISMIYKVLEYCIFSKQ